jgi:hypothetical protein
MNQRYQGDGPGGQTRKSAARAKPVVQAASSVHIKKKPQTDSEKRAARKAREKEEQRKADEKARKQAEKAKAEEKPEDKEAAAQQTKPRGLLGQFFAPDPNRPSSEEYRKWRKVYWGLLITGIVLIAGALIIQINFPDQPTLSMISLVCAYAPVIAAFVVDHRKVKPILKERQRIGTGNMSPKQLKHEQEAKERAAAVEAARKAAREAKKPARRKKSDDTIVPGDEQ